MKNQTLYQYLDPEDKKFIDDISSLHHFTFQQFRFLCEAGVDLAMWQEKSFKALWEEACNFNDFRDAYNKIKSGLKKYSKESFQFPLKKNINVVCDNSKKIFLGRCPAASEKTVCCNLHTLDVVEGCAFNCSYCSIDTFYGKNIVFNTDLSNIRLDKNKFYHIGTGQSSDALYWGNKNGLLDNLCAFADANPNILLELKTKSDNIFYFLQNKIPKNIVCSWTLNTPVIVENEEHFTPSLEARINAARQAADQKIKVGFHFHPMVYYDNWENDYLSIAEDLQNKFNSDEIAFISFGSVTFIKPAIKNLRKKKIKSKMLQMEMIKDPHGRSTYPDDIKIMMFRKIYSAFKLWHDKILFYLCMEKKEIWDKVFEKKNFNNNFFNFF